MEFERNPLKSRPTENQNKVNQSIPPEPYVLPQGECSFAFHGQTPASFPHTAGWDKYVSRSLHFMFKLNKWNKGTCPIFTALMAPGLGTRASLSSRNVLKLIRNSLRSSQPGVSLI